MPDAPARTSRLGAGASRYRAGRVLPDGGLTAHFDQTGSLLLGLAWLLALAVLAAWLFRRGPSTPARTGLRA